jgi:hypothetical protein
MLLGRILFDLPSREGEERSENPRLPHLRNPSEPLHPGPAQDPEEDGLDLIVLLMSRQDPAESIGSKLLQKPVSTLSRLRFIPGNCNSTPEMDRNPPPLSHTPQPECVLRAFLPESMIEVGRFHLPLDAWGRESEEMQ